MFKENKMVESLIALLLAAGVVYLVFEFTKNIIIAVVVVILIVIMYGIIRPNIGTWFNR